MQSDNTGYDSFKRRFTDQEKELAFFKRKEQEYLEQISALKAQLLIADEKIKISEDNLQRIEDKYHSLFNNAPLGIFRTTVDGRFIELNKALANMLGYDTPEEVMANITDIGKQIYVDPEKRRKIIEYAAKTSLIHRYENWYRKLDGSLFVANIYLRLAKDKQGNALYLEGMLEDITYRKKTEEILKKNEERLTKLNTILSETETISGIGGYEWNAKNNMAILSKGWQNIHGFFENKASFERIKKLAHPDDLPMIVQALDNALMGYADFNVEHRIIRQNDNQIRYIKSKGKIILNDLGEPVKIYGSVQDITEQKLNEQKLAESEKRFRFVADSTTELLCLHAPDGTYQHISPSVKRLLGYEVNELVGTNPYDLFHPADIDKIRNQSHDSALQGNPVSGMEYRIRKKDGTYIWFDTYTDLIYDQQGQIKSLITRSRDITEKIHFQDELKKHISALEKTEKQLRELNAAKDKFLSIVAHDLLNPFNSLLGFSKILLEKTENNELENIDHFSQLIYQSAQQGHTLLNNLLDWSRSETGSISFNPKEIDATKIITDVIELHHFMAAQKNISLRFTPTEDIMIYADADMLHTVLRNLVSNAIKYTNNGGNVSINITKSIDQVAFEVTDTGIGIQPTLLEKLFEKDREQSTTTGTANEKGTGLGLLICKDFIDCHGGQLHVNSEPGKGSTFSFMIPVSASQKG